MGESSIVSLPNVSPRNRHRFLASSQDAGERRDVMQQGSHPVLCVTVCAHVTCLYTECPPHILLFTPTAGLRPAALTCQCLGAFLNIWLRCRPDLFSSCSWLNRRGLTHLPNISPPLCSVHCQCVSSSPMTSSLLPSLFPCVASSLS